MLLDSIKKDLKIAMKAKETLKISTLRMITSSIKNIEINNRTSSKDESSNESLSDSEIIQLLSKMIKQRKESAEIYRESDRSDLEKKENDEIEIIEQYMPSQINDDEIDKLINEIIDETGSSSIKDMGRVMTILKEKYSGQMDFGKASLIVKEKLNS
ncbi:MAG: aspartyl-tRNA amidotransferase subunit B [Alphaproteobacteria bacterium]|nr:MAG: aspartyl-tRNA amidotransferase subunit B [Alphaproteobacteria bacterium]